MRLERLVVVSVAVVLLGAALLMTHALGSSALPPLGPVYADAAPGWTNVTAPPMPDTLAGAMMAYSPAANRFLLFGGWDGEGVNASWLFNPTNYTWSQIATPVAPSSRGDAQLAYDTRDGVFLLFGGWHENANGSYDRLSDTWAFSLGNRTWWELHPASAPSPRSDAAIAFDTNEGQLLLFGGFDGTAYLGDAWSYAYANNTWSPRPSARLPSARADGRMVFEASADLFFLYGGNDYSDPNLNFHHLADTWEYSWTANRWDLVTTHGSPGPRDYAVLAYDSHAGSLLLFGGYGNRTILGDTWAFDPAASSWQEVTSSAAPPPRFAGVGGYDAQDDVFVVFGGLGNRGLLSDTWILSHFALGSPNPSPRVYDVPTLGALLGIGIVVTALGVGLPQRLRNGKRTRGDAERTKPQSPTERERLP